MRGWAVFALAAAAAAGATAQPVRDAGACDADLAAGFVGKPGDQAEAARQAAGAGAVRLLKPGQIVTMEYRAERLTVELDLAGKIKGLRCG